MTRVGIVGAGWMGHEHARAWRTNEPRGVVVAVADASRDRACHLAEALPDADVRTYPDLPTMLAAGEIDAVDICLPHHLHAEAILQAARAGVAILCEKPVCTTLADAAEIGRVLKETGVTFMAAHNQLFQPSLVEARRLLDSGALGRRFVVRSIEAVQNRGFGTGKVPIDLGGGESPWAWRADPGKMGGGEVLDTGWHATYRLLALAEPGDRPVEVVAMTDRFHLTQLAVEDTGAMLVRFESGTIGELLTSWAFGTVGGFHFEVAAQHGSLAGGKTRLVHQLHGWTEAVETANDPHPTFTDEVAHFLDVLQRGAASLATFGHAARVLQVTMAAYASAAQRRVIVLPEDPTQPGEPAA